MSQTLQQQSLIFALSKCAIKIGIEKLSEKFDFFVLKLNLCQQGRFSKIRSHICIIYICMRTRAIQPSSKIKC